LVLERRPRILIERGTAHPGVRWRPVKVQKACLRVAVVTHGVQQGGVLVAARIARKTQERQTLLPLLGPACLLRR
jgi:hypothetical protein